MVMYNIFSVALVKLCCFIFSADVLAVHVKNAAIVCRLIVIPPTCQLFLYDSARSRSSVKTFSATEYFFR